VCPTKSLAVSLGFEPTAQLAAGSSTTDQGNSKSRWLRAPASDPFNYLSAQLPHVECGVPAAMALGKPPSNVLDQRPYAYGIIVCMKKTLHIDEQILREAKSAVGAKTDTDTVRLGLEALIRRAAYERLRALRGSEPRARDVRRRRARSSSARHAAA
jgi:hypothetical protein